MKIPEFNFFGQPIKLNICVGQCCIFAGIEYFVRTIGMAADWFTGFKVINNMP